MVCITLSIYFLMYFLTLWNFLVQTCLCFKVYKNISHQNYFFNKYFGLTKQKYTCRGAYFFPLYVIVFIQKLNFTCCLFMKIFIWPLKIQLCWLFLLWSVLLSSGLRDVTLDISFVLVLGNINFISMFFVTGHPKEGFHRIADKWFEIWDIYCNRSQRSQGSSLFS